MGELTEASPCPSPPPAPADHLVVFVHGILGSPADWKFAADQFGKMLPGKLVVHCSKCNVKLTLDGVDVMGERLAEEIVDFVNERPEIKKISFIAHSIGGLVARYAIGKLYRCSKWTPSEIVEDNNRGTIYGLEAVNFITAATPHLGSRGNKQVPFLFGFNMIENLAPHVIHLIFRRTGKHLFLTDSSDGVPPLLLRMVDDCGGLYFMSALRSFERRVVYSNVQYDNIVGWRTASIRSSESHKWADPVSELYPHIVNEEQSKAANPEVINGNINTYEEKLLVELLRLSWERVDVSFHKSRQRSAAHSMIQVKDPAIHLEGADVIQHMIDHFNT